MRLYKKLIEDYSWCLLVVGGGLFIVALTPWVNAHKLLIFLFSGIAVGLFYGAHNNDVWGGAKPARYEEIHNYWVHFIGGIAGGSAAYLLFIKSGFCLNDPLMLFCSLDWIDFILLLIVLLGYSGYIPRTLWFIANKGGPSK